ncbi:hypothetical protein [Kaarinaea lacus]
MSAINQSLKCPFRATLITRTFVCQYAEEITRREGPDIACNAMELNKSCFDFFNELKTKALAKMGHEDDLATLPASVLQKIQFGGLLGLQSQIDGSASGERVDNIAALIERASKQYDRIDHFPFDVCVDAVEAYKLKRRRNR